MTENKGKNQVYIISALRRKAQKLEDALFEVLDAPDIEAAHSAARKALEIPEKS